MKLTFDANNTKVYDNILDQQQFNKVFDFMNYVPMVHKRSHGEWNRVWGFGDGEILMANRYIWPRNKVREFREPEDCLTPFFRFVNQQIEESGLWSEEEKNDITTIVMTPYIWPPGSGLSWHNDSNYLGAFTFYAHQYWSPEWGGEFLTCEANDYILPDKKDVTWKVFDNQPLYDVIMDAGVGHYIQPKPNRLVLNKGGSKGILHKVNRSTANANARITLQGFIRAKGIEDDCCSE